MSKRKQHAPEHKEKVALEAPNEAIARFGPSGIMNTDQGSQFTSFA